jgi:hypothetical protein
MFRNSVFVMLLVLLITAPGIAQQSETADEQLVPTNVAPPTAPIQPLPFSHKTHTTLGLVCQTCHTNPNPGAMMTLPSTESCMSCHVAIGTETAAIKELHAFAESAEEIPWARVYAVTPGVTWSHRAHLNSGAQCETCHGDVRQVDAVAESTAVVAMASCISCHEAHEAETACVTCHAWPTDQLLRIE